MRPIRSTALAFVATLALSLPYMALARQPARARHRSSSCRPSSRRSRKRWRPCGKLLKAAQIFRQRSANDGTAHGPDGEELERNARPVLYDEPDRLLTYGRQATAVMWASCFLYCGVSKAHQRWLWHAIDHLTGVHPWHVGLGVTPDESGRIAEGCSTHFTVVHFVYRCGPRVYDRHLPATTHTVGNLRADRSNSTSHAVTRIKRLARKTLCFSKEEELAPVRSCRQYTRTVDGKSPAARRTRIEKDSGDQRPDGISGQAALVAATPGRQGQRRDWQ